MTTTTDSPEAPQAREGTTYTYRWLISEKMSAELRDWADEHYETEWSPRTKRVFKNERARVQRFMQDAIWRVYTGWRHEVEQMAAEDRLDEHVKQLVDFYLPFGTAREALDAILEEPSYIPNGTLRDALVAVVDADEASEQERYERAEQRESELQVRINELEERVAELEAGKPVGQAAPTKGAQRMTYPSFDIQVVQHFQPLCNVCGWWAGKIHVKSGDAVKEIRRHMRDKHPGVGKPSHRAWLAASLPTGAPDAEKVVYD